MNAACCPAVPEANYVTAYWVELSEREDEEVNALVKEIEAEGSVRGDRYPGFLEGLAFGDTPPLELDGDV